MPQKPITAFFKKESKKEPARSSVEETAFDPCQPSTSSAGNPIRSSSKKTKTSSHKRQPSISDSEKSPIRKKINVDTNTPKIDTKCDITLCPASWPSFADGDDPTKWVKRTAQRIHGTELRSGIAGKLEGQSKNMKMENEQKGTEI